MGDAGTKSSEQFDQITDKETHDAIVNKANQAANIPIVIVVTSSTPRSKSLITQLIVLSKKDEFQGAHIRWYEMRLTDRTTPMIKFGPQNCPIVILMRGWYCETLLGIQGVEQVEMKVRGMIERPEVTR